MTGGLAVLFGDGRLCAHHPGGHVRVPLDVTCLCLRPPRSGPPIEDLNVPAAHKGSGGTERGREGGRHRCVREKLPLCTAGSAGEATPSQSEVTVGHACPVLALLAEVSACPAVRHTSPLRKEMFPFESRAFL